MKPVLFCLFCAAIFACNVSDKKTPDAKDAQVTAYQQEGESAMKDSTKNTTIQWLDPVTQNLGTIHQGDVAEITWKFKNTGTQPLYVTNVRAGCGCTTPDTPKEPIAPGAQGQIKAKFNSSNFSGHVSKEVFVQANNSNRNDGSDNKLSFTAEIK